MLINFDMLQTKMAVVSRSAKHKMLAVNIPNTKVSTENFTNLLKNGGVPYTRF